MLSRLLVVLGSVHTAVASMSQKSGRILIRATAGPKRQVLTDRCRRSQHPGRYESRNLPELTYKMGHLHDYQDTIHSKAHWFSRLTSSSSSGVKSFCTITYRLSQFLLQGQMPLLASNGDDVHGASKCKPKLHTPRC